MQCPEKRLMKQGDRDLGLFVGQAKMSPSKGLERKVGGENSSFNEELTGKYVFIMLALGKAQPVGLICNETIAVANKQEPRRHGYKKACRVIP